jgi:acetyl-CoA C-acetyltransferase
MQEAVIISAVRTPIGKFQGSLQSYTSPQLGALVVREAVKRAMVEPASVDDCIMGCVLQAGLGQSPARQAVIRGGLPPSVGALTVNQVCGSGLRAVSLAAQAIQTGDSDVVVAGGMESMSNAPYLLQQARSGYRMGNGNLIDAMIHDGLWDVYNQFHMGAAAEMVAEKYSISREEQDAFAVESHRRAAAATAEGRFRKQILAVEVPPAKKGEVPRAFDIDEGFRPETTVQVLAKLKPAFKEGGTVTAGNAPGVSDGAAALVVTSAAKAKELARSSQKPDGLSIR